MPRPATLPTVGTVRVWLVASERSTPVLIGDLPGRHPGAVAAALPYFAFAFIVLTPSGRHTAWTGGPARRAGIPGGPARRAGIRSEAA
jgi:hypothetical protein